ncbi:MAG TPA: carbamate kinase [Acidimicrobiales bacterium]|nr:carbamate kinase [Acidimicrobiales bacterium]
MRLVVALGGNALLRRGEAPVAEAQHRNVAAAVAALAALAADHQLVVTHGNGPQVGLLALQAAAYTEVPSYPLDVLGAESEGMIGYLLEQHLTSALPGRRVATLLTQVEVDPGDPAFARPTKPIGPRYDDEAARDLAARRGWSMAGDGGGYRRVVPSPEPVRILELETIRLLVDAGVLVVCAGGGGIPVAVGRDGAVSGVEAVVDKDLAACLLAVELGAGALLLLTDVDALRTGWRTPDERAVAAAAPGALRAMAWEEGSMAPKVEGACRFVEATGRPAFIGPLADPVGVLAGRTGTRIGDDVTGITWRTG